MNGGRGTGAGTSGDELALTREGQSIVVTASGGALRSYRVGGRDVVVPFAPGAPTPGMHGAVLAPWPNRLDGGRYVFDGVEHRVPVNEPGRDNANHGFTHELRWRLASDGVSVTASVLLDGLPGYPFTIRLEVRYALGPDGLTITATATNRGGTDAPFGIGFHPWLSPGAERVDDCLLSVDAAAWVETDDRLLPAGVRPVPPELDYSTRPRPVGAARLDDGFAEAVRGQDGRSWVRLASPDGLTAAAWSRAPLDFWQICTGDFPDLGPLERAGVAAEPMSCPANALASGDHLMRLHPGRSRTVSWGLCLNEVR